MLFKDLSRKIPSLSIFYNCTREAKKERGPQRHCRARSQQWWQSLQEPLGDQIEASATGTGHGGWGAESYSGALVLEKGPSIYYSCIWFVDNDPMAWEMCYLPLCTGTKMLHRVKVRLTFKPVGPLKDKARGSFFWSKIVEYSSWHAAGVRGPSTENLKKNHFLLEVGTWWLQYPFSNRLLLTFFQTIPDHRK